MSAPPDPLDPPDPLVGRLRAAGCVYAEDEAALLRAEASGEALEALVARRVAGEPLEQVLGWAELAGVRVRLLAGVFVPRRRTAAVVELAVDALPTGGVLVDLCCGSGAVGAAVRARRPDVEVHAADVDPVAVDCARLNLPAVHAGDLYDTLPAALPAADVDPVAVDCARLNLPAVHAGDLCDALPAADVDPVAVDCARLNLPAVHAGDLYDALPAALRGRVDVLAVNAPYVPTDEVALMPAEARDHEHLVALDGGPDGLDLHRRVAAGAASWLAPAGILLLETSDRQAALTRAACEAAGLATEVLTRPGVGATVVRAGRRGASRRAAGCSTAPSS